MHRLVIHLGLPKTATTSLQTHIFPQLPGYLGLFYPGRRSTSTIFQELWDLYVRGDLIKGKRVLEVDGRPVPGTALETRVKEVVASDQDILLWSDEGLSLWRSPPGHPASWPVMDAPGALPRRGSHPIVGFLKHLRELLPQGVELKTILTLRNQVDWLGSLAAEVGVSDTEFVGRLIRDDDAFLNYYAITEDLEHLRGAENHLTLLFEHGLDHNVQQIMAFVGYSPTDFLNLEMSQYRENVRKSPEGWGVKRPTPLQRLEMLLRAVRDQSPFLENQLSSNEVLRRIFRPLIGFEARARTLRRLPSLAKQVSISLTEAQREAIRRHCEASNARLGEHLNMDLKTLGY